LRKSLRRLSSKRSREPLDQTLQSKAEVLFKKAFEDGSVLSKKLEEKIEQGFQQFRR